MEVFMKRTIFCLFLIVLSAAVFAQNVTVTGTFSYNNSENYSINFNGNRFSGTWGGDEVSGTFTISGDQITMRVIGRNDVWTWTIVNENVLRDHDRDTWHKTPSMTPSSVIRPPTGLFDNNVDSISFSGNRFNGARAGYQISGTFTISGNQMTMRLTGRNEVWTWTIVNENVLRDDYGSVWLNISSRHTW